MSDLVSLRSSGRTPPLPLDLVLDSQHRIRVVRWLRILPGKRLVGQAELEDGRQVLAKLFIASAAERHWRREEQGVQALRRAGIRTPELLAAGAMDIGGYYLLTTFLPGARTLQQDWDALPSKQPGDASAMVLLQRALAVTAAMHAKGLMQADLHLGNFLSHADQLYVIDGDAVSAQAESGPLSAEKAQANLALLFAQLAPEWDELSELLLVSYLQENPHRALNPDSLAQSVVRLREARLQDYLAKALRDCSLFSVQRSWWRFCSVLRSEQSRMAPLLEAVDRPFVDAELLKNGGSSTVARTRVADQELVVKRYNIKGFGHWLKRFWRPSRAWHSWLAAQRLQFLGIATPRPVAMLESRFGPLRRRAWLITDYCGGQDILSLLGDSGQTLPDAQQSAALLELFRQLSVARISHGDLKATNLLWHAEQVWLIDLDAMQAHRSLAGWRRAWAVERARFIRNWPTGSPLANWLEEQLPV